MSHTPGPWTAKRRQDGGFDVFGPPDSSGDASRKRFVGKVLDQGAGIGEAEANARLLAAAPELLEACRVAYAALPDKDPQGDWHAVAIALESAIKKATGESA